MRDDVMELRAHLVAEAEQAKREADGATLAAAHQVGCRGEAHCAEVARAATDAWLAADARLRALDGLIARAT